MLRSLRFAGVAVLLTLLATPPAAAHAAPPAGLTGIRVPSVTVPVTDGNRTVEVTGQITGAPTRVTLTVELTGAAVFGVADVRVNGTCDRDGERAVCTVSGPFRDGGVLAQVMVIAVEGSAPGDTGRIAVTARAGNGPVRRAAGTVTVAETVRLSADPVEAAVDAGATGQIRPRVRNDGTGPVEGVVLRVAIPAGLVPDQPFRNCTFDGTLVCVFDQVLAPGTAYEFSAGLPIRVPGDAAKGSDHTAQLWWFTPAEWAGEPPATGTPGSGAPVTLVPVPVPQTRAAQANAGNSPARTTLRIAVAGEPDTDIEIVVPEVRARRGEPVRMSVGWRNNGPGVLYGDLFAGARTRVDVFLPGTGVTIVDPAGCVDTQNAPQQEVYCTGQPAVVRPGDTVLHTLTLRFDRDATGADGFASIMDFLEPSNHADATPDNNAGTIPITLLAGSGGGSGGGSGPGLPVTGPAGGPAALIGLLFVLAGIACVRIGRVR